MSLEGFQPEREPQPEESAPAAEGTRAEWLKKIEEAITELNALPKDEGDEGSADAAG